LICERLLVEKDIGITEAFVEAVLHLFHALQDALEIAIARKDDETGIGSTTIVEGSVIRDVVLLWDRIICWGFVAMTEEARD
jgi:hypothetical protein